jgi:hypothetical protein
MRKNLRQFQDSEQSSIIWNSQGFHKFGQYGFRDQLIIARVDGVLRNAQRQALSKIA